MYILLFIFGVLVLISLTFIILGIIAIKYNYTIYENENKMLKEKLNNKKSSKMRGEN